MVDKKAPRCEGKRYGWTGKGYGQKRCRAKATGVVTTMVGFTEHHYCCDNDECYRSIHCGYPAPFKPFEKKEKTQ